jgi:hypothetical protein
MSGIEIVGSESSPTLPYFTPEYIDRFIEH